MQFITPKGPNVTEIKKAIDDALLATVEDAKVLFFMTYHNWDNPPEWEVKGPQTKAGTRQVIYQTFSKPYIYVANGTSGPYPITAKGSGFLHFKTGGTNKTQPGRFQSMASKSGDEWHSAKETIHPGIEARNPQKEVAEKVQPTLLSLVQKKVSWP